MGRTLGTIVQILQAEEAAWQAFRRALRTEDRGAFDRLWRHVRNHAVPASMANRPVPMEAILMAMVVGLAKELDEVKIRNAETSCRHVVSRHLSSNTMDPPLTAAGDDECS